MASQAPLVAVGEMKCPVITERIRFIVYDADSQDKTVGHLCESPILDAVGGKWSIRVYLGGFEQEHSGRLSILLEWKGPKAESPKDVCYLLRVVNQRDAKLSKVQGGATFKWVGPLASGRVFDTKTEDLLDPSKGFCVDNKLIFEAEITKRTASTASRIDEMQEAPPTLVRDLGGLLEVDMHINSFVHRRKTVR